MHLFLDLVIFIDKMKCLFVFFHSGVFLKTLTFGHFHHSNVFFEGFIISDFLVIRPAAFFLEFVSLFVFLFHFLSFNFLFFCKFFFGSSLQCQWQSGLLKRFTMAKSFALTFFFPLIRQALFFGIGMFCLFVFLFVFHLVHFESLTRGPLSKYCC